MSRPIIQEALEVTRENIRSLGPAGALAQVHAPYQDWLKLVDQALDAAARNDGQGTSQVSDDRPTEGATVQSAIGSEQVGESPASPKDVFALFEQLSDDARKRYSAADPWSLEWSEAKAELELLDHITSAASFLPRKANA